MNMLVDFLKFCVENEKNNVQNSRNTQEVFEYFINKYNGENVKDKKYKEVLDNIKNAHNAILNTTDKNAMDYREKNYLTAKELTLKTNITNGHSLTKDDENITKLNSAAFIATTIVLEATLAIGLIISLIVLVK